MSYFIDPGKMDKKITLYKRTLEKDARGSFVDTWPTAGWAVVCTRWAEVKPIRGGQYLAASQERADITHKITIRYTPDLETGMVISYAGRRLNIQSIINAEERNEWIEIMAVEEMQ